MHAARRRARERGAHAVCAVMRPQRCTVTGRPSASAASRASTSPAHLVQAYLHPGFFKGFWGSGFAAGREYPVTGPHRVGTHRLHQPMGAPQPRQYRRLPCCEENLHAPWGKALWMAVLCGCLKTSPRGAHRCPVGPVEGKQIK